MTLPPVNLERRVEQLESRLAALAPFADALERQPQGTGKRWTYWGVTSLPYSGSYPSDGTNTFPFRFTDPTFTPTAGQRTLTTPLKTSVRRFIGRSTNGQWIAPGELCMISPLPPPPGTTGKGRWLITPSKTYYEGFLLTDLAPGGSALASVYRQTVPGGWSNLGYVQTVRDSGFLQHGRGLRAGTWVRYEWETTAWVVTGPACIICEEDGSAQTSIQSSIQTSAEQTSEEQTSEPQTSEVTGCCVGLINRDLGIQGTDPEYTTPSPRTAPLFLTIDHPPPYETGGHTIIGPPRSGQSIEVAPGAYLETMEVEVVAGTLTEEYIISCRQQRDIITGDLDFPGDPSISEWILEGQWDSGAVRINNRGQAAWSLTSIGNPWYLISGDVNVLSCNPFHATFRFTPPNTRPGDPGAGSPAYYPVGGAHISGSVVGEITE